MKGGCPAGICQKVVLWFKEKIKFDIGERLGYF